MSLRQFVVAALALLAGAQAASSCCFVVQDEAHEIYWSEYTTVTYTSAVDLTIITTLLTPLGTTTLTNYETNVRTINKVFTTTVLVTDNPVSLYTNPSYAMPQKTEILAGSEPIVTGGVTVNSPTGFWLYSTAKVFAAPAVTDANGNVACGTLSSFLNVAPTAAACNPTFNGINGNAAANFDNNAGTGVEISLTTPFIHIPTRAGLQISPTEACVQGNGTENYGYPVQQLIDHLAGNAFYSAQYPGIENCIPAGPSIQAVQALAVAVSSTSLDPPSASADPATTNAAASGSSSSSVSVNSAAPTSSSSPLGGAAPTESNPGGGITSSTTSTVIVTSSPSSSPSSSSTTSETSSPVTSSSSSASSVPALSELTSSQSSLTTTGPESVATGGILPASSSSSSSTSSSLSSTSSSSSSTSSLSVATPQPELNSTSSPTTSPTAAAPVSIAQNSTTISSSSSSSIVSSAASSTSSALQSTSSTAVVAPESSNTPSLTSSVTSISSSLIVIVPSATTTPLVVSISTPAAPAVTGLASSMKGFVPWKLLLSITGLVLIRVW